MHILVRCIYLESGKPEAEDWQPLQQMKLLFPQMWHFSRLLIQSPDEKVDNKKQKKCTRVFQKKTSRFLDPCPQHVLI